MIYSHSSADEQSVAKASKTRTAERFNIVVVLQLTTRARKRSIGRIPTNSQT